MSDPVLILNRGLEERKTRSGKSRFAIRIDSEPIIINNDPKSLGKPVAEAIAHHFRERIRGITEIASAATLKARTVAAKAYAEGKQWAIKRYSGGRIGALAPNQSDRAFNDSGRFANSIVANASSDGAWRINVAASRLNPETAGSGGVQRIWNRLVELVPEFGDPALLLSGNAILKRVIESIVKEQHIKKGKMSTGAPSQLQVFARTFLRAADGDSDD